MKIVYKAALCGRESGLIDNLKKLAYLYKKVCEATLSYFFICKEFVSIDLERGMN
jgi:hypothetical protein